MSLAKVEVTGDKASFLLLGQVSSEKVASSLMLAVVIAVVLLLFLL